MRNKKLVYSLYLIILNSLGIITLVLLYIEYLDLMILGYNTYEGAGVWLSVVLLRMCASLGCAIYLFRRWFKQGELHVKNVSFLFGIVFLLFIYIKAFEIVRTLAFFLVDSNTRLILSKIYLFLALLILLPLLYLSIDILLKNRMLHKDKKYLSKVRAAFVLFFFSLETLIIIFGPNLGIISILFAIFTLFTLITVVYIFFYSWKYKYIKEIHPLIIGIGFLIVLLNQITWILILLYTESYYYVAFGESIDTIGFIIIFIGFLKKFNVE